MAADPMSVAEVADNLGKSPQTVHYHVKELIKLDLLIPVEERKRHARTEKLYVRTGWEALDQGAQASPEYNRLRSRSFALTAKTMVRETELMYRVMEADPDIYDFSTFRRISVRMTREQALELRTKMRELLTEAVRNQPATGGVRMHLLTYARPTEGQSREWAKQFGVPVDSLLAEDEEEV